MYKKTLIFGFIIFGLIFSGAALAGTKFINKDTAKDRENIRMGTRQDNNEISIESGNKSNIMSTRPKEKDEKDTPNIGPILIVPEIKR
ncbi:hypothetical protein [Maridesulfovibrio ferrireducens]|uniref:hypothetical protein n=1 Tax=Maridesulfovibrio ferrireducens TaxID=246191 RepID=UPI001A316D8A|nr:hypothetical protein [Maridesulfovibrio ferrireducens]MBI9112525.1 hypothetical protein [Maridesulfovibrio ferrireducens]